MNLLKRIIIGVIFVPLLLWIYYHGGIWLIIAYSLLTMLCTYELLAIFPHTNNYLLLLNILFGVLLFCLIAYDLPYIVITITAVILASLGYDVISSHTQGAVARASGALFACLYPAIGFGLLYRLTEFHPTLLPVLAVLIWLIDTAAYFVGANWGRHRGIFKCSPNKSLEGFYAGLFFAFVGSVIAHIIYPHFYSWKLVAILTFASGLFGQIGDLMESVIKRDIGVKDSSNIIPGHGGVLDRFDSLLVAGPVLYIILIILL